MEKAIPSDSFEPRLTGLLVGMERRTYLSEP